MDHPGFLAAIIADPEEDVHRLAYADWLEEHGEPERGAFIRVQVELACLEVKLLALPVPGPRQLTDCFSALRRRERELLPQTLDRPDWIPDVVLLATKETRIGQGHRGAIQFRRGFVARVDCTLADWCGAECGACGGDGIGETDTGGNIQQYHCPDCHGTGCVGGHGPDLVRCCPLEWVTLTDAAGILPDQVLRFLPPHDSTEITAALLSAALLAWAKSVPVKNEIASPS